MCVNIVTYEPGIVVRSRRDLFFRQKTRACFCWSMHLMDVVIFYRFGGPSKHPVVYDPAAGDLFLQNARPCFLGAFILWMLLSFIDFRGAL